MYRFKMYRFVIVPFCNVPLCISTPNIIAGDLIRYPSTPTSDHSDIGLKDSQSDIISDSGLTFLPGILSNPVISSGFQHNIIIFSKNITETCYFLKFQTWLNSGPLWRQGVFWPLPTSIPSRNLRVKKVILLTYDNIVIILNNNVVSYTFGCIVSLIYLSKKILQI
jgi:hypothetical protein